MYRLSFFAAIGMLCFTTTVWAEEVSPQRGLVTSSSCPLSCGELGVPRENCKEWSAGDRCFVEDTRSPAGHRSLAKVRGQLASSAVGVGSVGSENMGRPAEVSLSEVPNGSDNTSRRGLVTSSQCPFTCEDAGVPRDQCREYQGADVCRVEDLRQAPGHRSMVRVPR